MRENAVQDDDGWLDLGDVEKFEAGTKIPLEHKRGLSMAKKLTGVSRMWACDGEYVYYRPTRVINGVKTKVANPTTEQRHQNFLDAGQYTYVGTQDDVEIYKLDESSPFYRRPVYLGELSDSDVRRQVALAACKRDWPLYVDCLEELAGRIKGRYDSAFASQVYGDQLQYISNLIRMRGGPSEAECAAGLADVRRKRGHGTGRVIVLPNGRAD